MRAAQVTDNGAALALSDIPRPEATGDQVLIKVQHCGICHTDLHLHDGFFGLGGEKKLALKQNLPLTMGHEIQGQVHAFGDNVSGFSVGEQVAVYPWIGCGSCRLCDSDREHLCARARAVGVNVPGGYAEYVIAPHPRYVLPIGNVDPRQAALLMCSGLSTYSALSKAEAAFNNGAPVAIIGFGGLGQMALEIARARFGRLPVVLDVSQDKLALARSLGATAYDLNASDVARDIKSAHGDIGAVIDFVGAETTSAMAGRISGQAGHIVIVGLFGGMFSTPLPLMALRGTTVQGSYVGSLAEARAVLALAQAGKLKPIDVTNCELAQINDAFLRLRDGQVNGRLIINFNN